MNRRFLPTSPNHSTSLLLLGRGVRAFADGYVAVLLPAYLIALGIGTWHVGVLATTTLLGSALATLAIGVWGHHLHQKRLLLGAALLMAATGFTFAASSTFWPLLLVALLGTLNPSSGDVSLFLPLEHARIAEAADGDARIALFARYSLVGSLLSAFGALAAALPSVLSSAAGVAPLNALRSMFVLYGSLAWWSGCFIANCHGLTRRRPSLWPRWGLLAKRSSGSPRFSPWTRSREASSSTRC